MTMRSAPISSDGQAANRRRSAGRPIDRRGLLRAAAGLPVALAFGLKSPSASARTVAAPAAASNGERRGPAVAGVVPGLVHLGWVWQFRRDGDRHAIRGHLAAHGLGIALKTHDGRTWMSRYDTSPDAVSGPDQIAALAAFFEEGGVPFHAWAVLHGAEPEREAEMASAVLDAGARSISLDLESYPGFWRGSDAGAERYADELRARQPDAWIQTSIDARPWELDRIPIEPFARIADSIAPQVYWSDFATAGNLRRYRQAGEEPGPEGMTALFALDVAARRLEPFERPLHPIGPGLVDDTEAWGDFIEGSFERGAETLSVWRFGTTAPSVWELLRDTPPRPRSYVVQADDTLSALAARWDSEVSAIARLNGIRDPNLLQVGQRLLIPRGAAGESLLAMPASYVVQPGDTLSEIAEFFDTTVEALQRLNGIADPSHIRDGVELRLR
jgi:LysM repeat protein